VEVGHAVPFERQTVCPFTVRLETASLEPVAFTKLNSEMVPVAERKFVVWRFVV
jgi:hypothetical protein